MSSQSTDLFFRACEVAGPPRLVAAPTTGGPGAGRCFTLGGPFAVVGSDPRCDVHLDDPRVSGRQFYLQAIGPRLLCVDLEAEPVFGQAGGPSAATWIDRDHGVYVGGQLLRLDAPPAPAGGAAAAGRDAMEEPLISGPVPRVVLEFQTRRLKSRWSMKQGIALVGSAPGCSIRLNCRTVSPYHAAVVRTGVGLWVVDLLGGIDSPEHGEVCVNGAPVRFALIEPGDTLQVGRFLINTLYLQPPRPRSDFLGQPSGAAPEPVAEALRREFEARLSAEAERHRAEVASLRRAVEELREWADGHPAYAPAGRHQDEPWTAVHDAGAHRAASPRGTTVRTLGAASRLDDPAPQVVGLFEATASPDFPPAEAFAATPEMGLMTSAPPDAAPLTPAHDPADTVPGLDGVVVATTHDQRLVP